MDRMTKTPSIRINIIDNLLPQVGKITVNGFGTMDTGTNGSRGPNNKPLSQIGWDGINGKQSHE